MSSIPDGLKVMGIALVITVSNLKEAVIFAMDSKTEFQIFKLFKNNVGTVLLSTHLPSTLESCVISIQ